MTADMRATPYSARGLGQDNRGAIMVLGIFMACAMVGLMWYMIGVGDALIWRDRSQEAADSMAFTSAAIHAHSMNIIAFLNIVMSILAAIYLLAAMIFNLTDFILVIIGRNDDHCHWYQWIPCGFLCIKKANSCDVRDFVKDVIEVVLGFFTDGATWEDVGKTEFCSAAAAIQAIHDPLAQDLGGCVKHQPGKLIKTYEDDVLGPVNYYSAKIQRGIARIGPWAGAVLGTAMGLEYQDRNNGERRYGTAISPSMATGEQIDGYKLSEAQRSIDWLIKDKDPRLGLPIGEMRMGYLCYRDVKWVGDLVLSKLGFVGSLPIVGGFLKTVINGSASAIERWYCANDSIGVPLFKKGSDLLWTLGWPIVPFGNPWFKLKMRPPPYAFDYNNHPFWNDKDTGGPKVMMEYAENSNDWMQVWGVVFPINRAGITGAKEVNDSEHLVGLAGFEWNDSHNSRTLYSEAKNVYYSSAEFYLDKTCKWDDLECNGSGDNSATFSLQWRARLRRVHSPAWGQAYLDWFQGGTHIPVNLMTNAKFLKVLDFISNYLLDDPQAKYTTAYKALSDGKNHKAGHTMDAKTLVPDAFH
jgi:hypothetical protein